MEINAVESILYSRHTSKTTTHSAHATTHSALLGLATEHNLTNAAQLAERRQFARREQDRAEAMEIDPKES